MAGISKDEYLAALESAGMTGHPGGIAATETLIGQLSIRRGERVLDLGCGTGYTACHVARKQQANVVAADLRPAMLKWVERRIQKEHVTDMVHPVAADAHRLPFRGASFDAAMVESVLVFCDVPVALAELFRVLKPGGRLGCNEVTALRRISREQLEKFEALIGVMPAATTAEEWTDAFKAAGFADVAGRVKPIDWLDAALFTPVRTDGAWRYLAALAKSLTDPKIRKISRGKGAFVRAGLMRDLGSGIYFARKPPQA